MNATTISTFISQRFSSLGFFALSSLSSLGFFAILPRNCRVRFALYSRGFRGGFGEVSLRERRKGEDRAKTERSQPLTHPKGMAVISGKIVLLNTLLKRIYIKIYLQGSVLTVGKKLFAQLREGVANRCKGGRRFYLHHQFTYVHGFDSCYRWTVRT